VENRLQTDVRSAKSRMDETDHHEKHPMILRCNSPNSHYDIATATYTALVSQLQLWHIQWLVFGWPVD
jgi:hypothetical protein